MSEAPSPDDIIASAISGCSDDPFDYFDDAGKGCDWYALEDRNCVEFGGVVGAGGKTPNEA